MLLPSPSPLHRRFVARRFLAAFGALACAGLAGGAPVAFAQPQPAKAAPKAAAPTKAGTPGKPPPAAPASTASVVEPIEGSDEVQKLYMEGDDAFKRLAYQEADAAFTKAWALSKSFDVAGRLGETKLEMGRHREAAQYLSFALRNALPSTRASRRDALKKALDDAKKKLATVKLSASVVEAKILVDGTPMDPIFLGPEVFVDPGSHTFLADANGFDAKKQTVEMKAGEIYVVTLTLEKTAAKAPPGSVPPPPAPTPLLGKVLGGVGGLGLVLGGVFIGVAESRKNDANGFAAKTIVDGKHTCPKQGPGPTDTCDKLRSATGDVDLFGNMGIGALIGGGVLIAGAAGYVLFFAPKEPEKAPDSKGEKGEPAATSRVVPVVGPTGGGLLWTGSF